MLRVREVVVVEGKYDQIKLSSIINGLVLTTNGFSIYRDKEKMALLKSLARERGIIILTDSDAAGLQIRNYLANRIGHSYVKHAYLPDRRGKESRKAAPSKEGKLGVEGMPADLIRSALETAGAMVDAPPPADPITNADLYAFGLTGGEGSVDRRQSLKAALDLPERLSKNTLLQILNMHMSRREFAVLAERLFRGL